VAVSEEWGECCWVVWVTELGDVVGQASEACPRDKNTNVSPANMDEPRTEQRVA
jgi:hypothetical protein